MDTTPDRILGRCLSKVKPLVSEAERSPMGAMKKLIQEQPDIRNLALGEASFDPPDELVQIASSVMADKVARPNRYTTTRGLPEMRKAVARFTERLTGIAVDADETILITVGGTEALHLATKVLLEPGDRVLLANPGWGPMATLAQRQGAALEYYELEKQEAWHITEEPILERLEPGVKLVVVNSPSNPTGAMISAEGLRRVVERAKETETFVISDEVYHNFAYSRPFASALPYDPSLENLMLVNSFSKSLAITGWRLGYAIAHPWLIRQMDVYKESMSACTPSVAQWAVAQYLDSADEYLAGVSALCESNVRRLTEIMRAIPGVKCPAAEGGFYLFPSFEGMGLTSMQVVERLLRGGVAVTSGSAFGSLGEAAVRLCVAMYWEDLEVAARRIEAALTSS